jgi:metal-responsive CopG/Arc/MetJ family transcriptional regulator
VTSKAYLPDGTRKIITNIPKDLLDDIDEFAVKRNYSRAAAMRTLIRLGLKSVPDQKGNQ